MKDPYEVLRQKEADLARVGQEIESLQVVASLLSDDLTSDELTKKKESAAEKTLDRGFASEATGTDGLLSPIAASAPLLEVSKASLLPRRFWKSLKRGK
jgi:hypothetical protein